MDVDRLDTRPGPFGWLVSDEGRRASDIVNLAIVAGDAGRWIALRLSDGGSDGVVYDTRADAVEHQLHETQCAYVRIPRDGMSPRAATTYIKAHRQIYANGFKMSDPAGNGDPNREIILPRTIRGM